jgi:multidrug efflux system outer membrane protein
MLLLAAACSFEPRYQRPAAPVPRDWPHDDAFQAATTSERKPMTWQQLFRHPSLRGVVVKALGGNRGLRVAAADVWAARAQYRLARAGLAPQIAVSADASLFLNLKGDVTDQLYQFGLGATNYEIDLFGRIRSLSHAAQENYFASQAGARALRLILVADTASAWLNMAAQRNLLAIAKQTEESASESVRVTQSRLSGGVASELDVRQAETIMAQARSDVAAYTTTVAQARNALALLVGGPLEPGELPDELDLAADLLSEVPAGVSSVVLLARPDVLQAEYVLKAANANIGAARAAFFPTVSLTAIGGLMSSALSSLVSLGAAGFQLAPGAALPIFTGGANEARLEYARAQRARYVANYERVIQVAFREVADALARRGTIAQQISAQQALVAASEASYRLSEARYKAGADSYLNALDAQRTLYGARRSLVLVQQSRVVNVVELYRALGGG